MTARAAAQLWSQAPSPTPKRIEDERDRKGKLLSAQLKFAAVRPLCLKLLNDDLGQTRMHLVVAAQRAGRGQRSRVGRSNRNLKGAATLGRFPESFRGKNYN